MRERRVLLREMERCGQLAIEMLRDRDEFLRAAAFDQQGRGAKDLLQQIGGLKIVFRCRGEEHWLTRIGARLRRAAGRELANSAVLLPLRGAVAIRAMNAGVEHRSCG